MRSFAWVTLDASDSDPLRFWTYATQALRVAAPDLGSGSLSLLRAPGVDLEAEMLPVLVEELAGVSDPVVLAFDDYHLLQGDGVHGTLRRLLDYLPERACIAIGSAPSRRCRWPGCGLAGS